MHSLSPAVFELLFQFVVIQPCSPNRSVFVEIYIEFRAIGKYCINVPRAVRRQFCSAEQYLNDDFAHGCRIIRALCDSVSKFTSEAHPFSL